METHETGAASILITLSDGRITVNHGTDKIELASWGAKKGDWGRLWQTIRDLKAQSIKQTLNTL